MKLLTDHRVEREPYPGIKVWAKPEQKFFAIDANGLLWSFWDAPKKRSVFWFSSKFDLLGAVDLEGMDWKDTLVKLED